MPNRDHKQTNRSTPPPLPFVAGLRSLREGLEFPANQLMNLSTADQSPVEIVLDLDRIRQRPDGFGWNPARQDMWRFGALLPIPPDAPDAKHIVSLGEGATPWVEVTDHTLCRRLGIRCRIKDEGGMHGRWTNPTGSFKDRGMSMAASMAHYFGLTRLAIPTQGNAGDSLAQYARAAGMKAAVAMPRDTPQPIIDAVQSICRADPEFELLFVDGTIREAGAALRPYYEAGWFNCATFQEPGWRIEGKKTLGLEIAEPPGAGEPWSVPDVIVYPTGGGTGILGMWKAFAELSALGLLDSRRPRMISVQSAATTPLVTAMAQGLADSPAIDVGATCAVGLNVPNGVGHFRVLEILRESGGGAIAVADDAIARIGKDLDRSGLRPGPEGAAALAALPQLYESGLIRSGDDVVVVNTGTPDKYQRAAAAGRQGRI